MFGVQRVGWLFRSTTEEESKGISSSVLFNITCYLSNGKRLRESELQQMIPAVPGTQIFLNKTVTVQALRKSNLDLSFSVIGEIVSPVQQVLPIFKDKKTE